MLLPGHAKSVRIGATPSRREKRLIGAVLVGVGALAIALVISLLDAGPSSSRGCIYVTIPAATGAQQIHQCSALARATCRSVDTPGAFTNNAAQSVLTACRQAGLPTP